MEGPRIWRVVLQFCSRTDGFGRLDGTGNLFPADKRTRAEEFQSRPSEALSHSGLRRWSGYWTLVVHRMRGTPRSQCAKHGERSVALPRTQVSWLSSHMVCIAMVLLPGIHPAPY